MSEIEAAEAELPLDNAGTRLGRAREAAGMSRAQVCAIMRIPERHLVSIENSDYAALPARTYAVGFSRSYAKIVGLDPQEIAAAVRSELVASEPEEPRRTVQTFEPGDPARVPGSRLVWIALVGIAAVLGAIFLLARPMLSPAAPLPPITASESAATTAVPAPAALSGPAVFTALSPGIWVKFTDTAGNQLLQKELAQGESWTVPVDVPDVRLATARPEALAITIGGQPVAPLSDVRQILRNVPVTAAALLARPAPAAPAPAVTQSSATVRPRTALPARAGMAPAPTPTADTAPLVSSPGPVAT